MKNKKTHIRNVPHELQYLLINNSENKIKKLTVYNFMRKLLNEFQFKRKVFIKLRENE